MDLINHITALVNQKFEDTSYYLVDVKVSTTYKIQVFVDGDTNISIGICAEMSRYLESRLEAAELVPAKYTLEVSSPGMSNPFKIFRQYVKSVGKPVEVILNDGRKIEGILKAATEDQITVEQTIKQKKKKELEVKIHTFNLIDVKRTQRQIKF